MNQPLRAGTVGSAKRHAPLLVGAAAAALATTAAIVRIRAREAERRHPPVGRFMTVDGVRLHYLDRGRGSTIVLLHGNGATIDELLSSGLVDRLARTHRVVLLDRPGFGYSERPRSRLWTPEAQARLIRNALSGLGVEEAVVYGHSLGAQVAAALALAAPDLVRGLVLASGYYYPTARADVPLVVPPAIPILGDVLRYTIAPVLSRLLLPKIYAKLFGPSPVPERFLREFPHALVLRPWHLRAAAADTAFLIPTAAALEERYASLDLPVAIVAGEGDQVVDFGRHSRRLQDDIPGSRLIVVPGAGHMVHHSARDTVADAIEAMAGDVLEHGVERQDSEARWSVRAAMPKPASHRDSRVA